MFEKITPEQAGVPSRQVEKILRAIQRRQFPIHSLLMMKGDKLFAEYYWAPFDKNTPHRMYSQTKSYVGIAIGFLIQEGKLSLSDKVASFFSEKIDCEIPEHLANQTVEQMLTMTTVGECAWWFGSNDPDRTHLYFNRPKDTKMRPASTLWQYDSAGSQVLSNLVEKLSGMSLFDYLYDRVFRHLGTFQNATILQTRNGDAWGDSALICTPRDMASFARFVMNYGKWEGKQLLNEAYVRRATSKVVDNREQAFVGYKNGYGYQIWSIEYGGFAFIGMGNQCTLCIPDLDLIFLFTSDSQGNDPVMRNALFNYFYDLIVEEIAPGPLPENPEAYAKLQQQSQDLKLFSVQGKEDSAMRAELDGVVWACDPNRMGITSFSLHFSDATRGELHYTNAQGDKVLPFGINHNVFGHFPQYGYSNDRGGVVTTDGFLYKDAVSAAWLADNKIMICAQIIDRYFGNCSMIFAFAGDEAVVNMVRTAENFLNEYEGSTLAKRI